MDINTQQEHERLRKLAEQKEASEREAVARREKVRREEDAKQRYQDELSQLKQADKPRSSAYEKLAKATAVIAGAVIGSKLVKDAQDLAESLPKMGPSTALAAMGPGAAMAKMGAAEALAFLEKNKSILLDRASMNGLGRQTENAIEAKMLNANRQSAEFRPEESKNVQPPSMRPR